MLPSFAQAFASDSMSTTLPPIRKRPVKSTDDGPAASTKKRRLTHSPHPLRTDLDPHQSNSTPISPIGFTVQRDFIDHVRSVKQIRKKQEALIEQRRGSAAGLPDDPAPPKNQSPQQIQTQPLQQLSQQNTTPSSSPNTQNQIQTNLPPSSASGPSSSRLPPPPISFANRAINAGKRKPADLHLVSPRDSASRYSTRHSAPSLQPAVQSAPPSQNSFSIPMSLPRLPSNLISSGPSPPIAIAGGGRVPPTPTRLSMQASSASSATANIANGKSPPASIPIASTLVPQTPTTLAINRVTNFGNSLLAQSQIHPPPPTHLHPPNPSAPTSSTSTSSPAAPPSSAAAAAQAKQAFLAPFELFYDALYDARQLKDWLNEQLARTSALMRRLEDQQNQLHQLHQQLLAGTAASTQPRNDRTKKKTVVKSEEGEVDAGGVSEERAEELGIREELEKLRRKVEELAGRLGAGTTATATTTASSSSSTSSNSSHEGYTFPQQQQQRYEHQREQREQHGHPQQQQQPEYQPSHHRERDHQNQECQQPQHLSASASRLASVNPNPSLTLPSIPSISGRLTVSGRPELGRRLSSPGWQPSSMSLTGRSGPGYRVVARVGDGHLERERERENREIGRLDKEREGRHVAVSVSKSLSGPGVSGSPGNGGQSPSGVQAGSKSRRGRTRRVSISGMSVSSVGAKTRGAESESAAEQRPLGTEARERREEMLTEERDGLQEAGGMDVDSPPGGDGNKAREMEREPEPKREDENDRDRESCRKGEEREDNRR